MFEFLRFFGSPRFQSPFDFTLPYQTSSDIYAKLVCESAQSFLRIAKLPLDNMENCEKATGWLFFVMFHRVHMETEEVTSIIQSLQRNMLQHSFKAAQINSFFQHADGYYRRFVAAENDFRRLHDAGSSFALDSYIEIFFGKMDADEPMESYMDKQIRIASAIHESTDGFLESDQKIQSDLRNTPGPQ